MPDIIPDKGGAPDARAIPSHNGKATKKTTRPDGKLALRLPKKFIFFVITENIYNAIILSVAHAYESCPIQA